MKTTRLRIILICLALACLPCGFAQALGSINQEIQIEKRVYNCDPIDDGRCNSEDGRSVEKSTFEPGDIAGISIKVNPSVERQIKFHLRDFLPEGAVSPIEVTDANSRNKYCHIDQTSQVLTGMSLTQEGYVQWEDLSTSSYDQYLCYTFGVGEGIEEAKHKNIVNQINAVAYGSALYDIGDVNQDGQVTVSDEIFIMQIIVGFRQSPSSICLADVNQDGKIDVSDAIAVGQIIIGNSQSPGQCRVEMTVDVGDANGDGQISENDATVVGEIVNGMREIPSNICQFDADQDGQITVNDMIKILRIVDGSDQSPGQCSIGSGDFENVIGSSNNYLMVRGYPFIQSQEDPNLLDATAPYKINMIEDELAFAFTRVLLTEPNQVASSVPSYLYLRGSGQKSRGGTLISLPVRMTDMSESSIFFSDQFYLLYNPLFYIFGNMFSGSSPSSTAFDFGHGSSAISTGDFGNEKLNSASSLYNYYFDEKSVIFWDRNNKDKNTAMEGNISRILGTQELRPDDLCQLDSANSLRNSTIYLNNQSCSLVQTDNSSIWPSGRVWYLKANSDVEISSTIKKGGTLVVDFSEASYVPTVKINTQEGDFSNDSFLGLIVINGGKVEFTGDAEYFRGAVFVPGRGDSDPERRDGEGKIVFAEDGRPLKIRGSLIADEIDFNKRQKNDKEFAVSVYADSALVNSRIPGFERLMSMLIGG